MPPIVPPYLLIRFPQQTQKIRENYTTRGISVANLQKFIREGATHRECIKEKGTQSEVAARQPI